MPGMLENLLGTERYATWRQSLTSFNRLVHPRQDPETRALPLLVKPGQTVFDIGANYAQYVRVLSRLTGAQGKVYAFEQDASIYRYLERNCRWLKLQNTESFHVALAAFAESTHTDSYENNDAESLPAVTTLDLFVEEHHVPRISFIRCSAEGAEFQVLRGAQQVLESYRPNLLLEIHSELLPLYDTSMVDIVKLLQGFEYRFFVWRNNRMYEIFELKDGNVFCLNRETVAEITIATA